MQEFACPALDVDGQIRLPATCHADFSGLEEPFSVQLSFSLELHELISGFPSLIEGPIPNLDCDKAIISNASLAQVPNALRASATIHADKRICALGGWTRVIEKTARVTVDFRPYASGSEFGLEAVLRDDGLNDAERLFLEIANIDLERKIREALEPSLAFSLRDSDLPKAVIDALEIRQISILDNPPRVSVDVGLQVSQQVIEGIFEMTLK